MTSLYIYFNDLTELLLAALGPVMAKAEDAYVSLLRPHWPGEELAARACAFVTAYYGFWVKHSRLLHLRNTMADRRDERLAMQRVGAAQPLMRLLTRQIAGSSVQPDSRHASMAMALLTSLERVVILTSDDAMQQMLQMLHTPFESTYTHLLHAEARLLELGIRDYRLLAGE